MPIYTVRKFEAGILTGREWRDINALTPEAAAKQVLGTDLIRMGTPGRLAASVTTIVSFKPNETLLYESPHR